MRRVVQIIIGFYLLIGSIDGQIKGDGNIITKQIEITSIDHLDISLYAKIEVDMSQPVGMTMTADANLFEHIDYEVLDGRLELSQKQWIRPSEDIIIKIGAPDLYKIQQGTHETVIVKGIDRDVFNATALVGDIVLMGRCKILYAGGEVGDIDATGLDAEEVEVNLWNWGKIKLDAPKTIKGIVKDDGQIIYESENTEVDVQKKGGGKVINRLKKEVVTNPDARFIKFKIKNNSLKRINAYVRGPKPDGSFFSYGFPMLPGQVRKKDWTVGTKVFRVTRLGIKKLLLEITEDDEGEVVKMYADR